LSDCEELVGGRHSGLCDWPWDEY